MSEAIEYPEDFTPEDGEAHSEPRPEGSGLSDEPEAVATEEPPVPAEDDRMKWYIIHSYSGFENKVAESLRTRAEAFGFNHKVGQILIPTEEVVELRNGK